MKRVRPWRKGMTENRDNMNKPSPEMREIAAKRLRSAGLRPTRQRLELATALFEGGDRHVTAEDLRAEMAEIGARISLATVYNALHQFTEAGILRQVVVDATRSYFDTNTGDHQHFFLEEDGMLIDIPGESVTVAGVPAPPQGLAIDRVDVVIRVKRSGARRD
jgi:Fur family iron response transcriptional regulator